MNLRNVALWIFIALIVFGLFNLFSNTSTERNNIDLSYSQFLDEVENAQKIEKRTKFKLLSFFKYLI